MGYCTLYGDMNGALSPIGGLYKTEVFALCKRINSRALETGAKAPIPQAIIDKPPSAELRPDQQDQDSLPPYEVLDEILELYLCKGLSKEKIVQQGFNAELADKIIKTVSWAEFKRRQAAPVLRIDMCNNGGKPLAYAVYEI